MYNKYKKKAKPQSLFNIVKFNLDNITKQTNNLIKFEYITTTQPIKKNKDYIEFVIDKTLPTCDNSPTGCNTTGVGNTINLRCIDNYLITHEILHSLGFKHEHQRYDVEKYFKMQICDENFKRKHNDNDCSLYKTNYEIRNYILDYEFNLPFDFNSVMLYAIKNDWTKNYSSILFFITKYLSYYDFLFNDPRRTNQLSKLDIQKLKTLYGP